jgi:hypothetical protein
MYLHLATDNKFIDYFIRRQRAYFPHSPSRYIIITENEQLQYVKSAGVELFRHNSTRLIEFINQQNIDRIYVHYLVPFFYEVIAKIPKPIKVYWMFWGADGFSLPHIYPHFLDRYALSFYRSFFYEGKKNKWFHRGIFLQSTWEKLADFKLQQQWSQKAFKRIDHFCHYIEEDYFFLKRKLKLSASYLEFNYCGIYDLCPVTSFKILSDFTGNAVLGNSANEANNHISLMHVLKKSNFHFERIYCPLSYGGKTQYRDEVIDEGRKLFGERFFPLVDFMPKDEYDKILETCSHFFHNHYRSQAYGNIVFQLAIGGHVYMNSKSSLFRYLNSRSISIGEINDDFISPPSDISSNSSKLTIFLSEEVMNRRYQNVLE